MWPLLFLLGFSIPEPKSTYRPLYDQSWVSCNESSFSIQHNQSVYHVNYTYCTATGKISSNYIDSKIVKFSKSVLQYVDSLGWTPRPCKKQSLLEIYEVTIPVLNDSRRFGGWQSYSPGVDEIWALYDPRGYNSGLSAIVLTKQSGWDDINFGHELAHYWQDRLCLTSDFYSNERFANGFEPYINSGY
jgi:hypothetical protein